MKTELALHEEMSKIGQRAKSAARVLANVDTLTKNDALAAIAVQLERHREAILRANAKDVAAMEAENPQSAKTDRLRLTEARLTAMEAGLCQVATLADPVGHTLTRFTTAHGLDIEQRTVPLGVIGMIYESRPNVTVDAVALCLKSGNAVILRGGKEAIHSNTVLVEVIRCTLNDIGLPIDTVQLLTDGDRRSVLALIQAREFVDLVIPRGGAGLISHVVENAHVPVIETGTGNCHIYVHAEADIDMAQQILLNAKLQRPSVCNAAETLLVDTSLAANGLLTLVSGLLAHGVELRACARTLAALQAHHLTFSSIQLAIEEDFETEFLDAVIAIKLVDDVDDAIRHIARYGTAHSETIVTGNQRIADKFLASVDAAVVYHNASTRFTDGEMFGFGCEIGISTQKLHVRGPMGLRALTSYKYIARGTGQIRP